MEKEKKQNKVDELFKWKLKKLLPKVFVIRVFLTYLLAYGKDNDFYSINTFLHSSEKYHD